MPDTPEQHEPDRQPPGADESQEQLHQTAEHWRAGETGSEADESAAEVARGAERGAEQPDYGREGS